VCALIFFEEYDIELYEVTHTKCLQPDDFRQLAPPLY